MGERMFVDEREQERCIGRGTRLNSGGMQAGRARRERHNIGRHGTSRKNRDTAMRTAPDMSAA